MFYPHPVREEALSIAPVSLSVPSCRLLNQEQKSVEGSLANVTCFAILRLVGRENSKKAIHVYGWGLIILFVVKADTFVYCLLLLVALVGTIGDMNRL